MGESTSAPLFSGMRLEDARERVNAFREQFGIAHLYFAQHAAFPISLTSDLLYRLWANFQRDIAGEKLHIPWIAVADLLLSSLCEEVGYEFYEMNVMIRAELLSGLKASPRFGQRRINALSYFLLDYVRQQLYSNKSSIRDFAQAQQLTALAYIQPERATREFAEVLQTLDQNNKIEQIRLASLMETLNKLAEPLSNLESFAPLLTYARGVERLARGDREGAKAQFDAIKENEQSPGLHLPTFEQVEGESGNTGRQAWEMPDSYHTSDTDIPKIAGVHLLWVDDHPENNIYERGDIEALGIQITLSKSTEDALEKVYSNTYDVIISDMGRQPLDPQAPYDARAGYRLLDTLRKQNILTPFIIYAGSSSPRHQAETQRHGGFGTTNDPQVLIQMVIDVVKRFINPSEEEPMVIDVVKRFINPSEEEPKNLYSPLSTREVEILDYIARGNSNKEIAKLLKISDQTVKNHITSILKKLSVNDRTAAVVHALRHGWIKVGDSMNAGSSQETLDTNQPITVLLCYAREDERVVKQIKNYLSPLTRNGLITVWDYGNINAGTEWEQEIVRHLGEAQIILLFITASFLASDFSYTVEMRRAIERHERKEARVIPVILRSVSWQEPPLDKLQVLPDNAKPISRWTDRDEGFLNVANGIKKVIEQWDTHNLPEPVEERRTMIANFDQLIEAVNARLEPPARAEATAKTLQQLSIYIPNDVTLADLMVGWQTLTQSATQEEDIAIERRRVTCRELANIASQFTEEQGNLAQAIRVWEQWIKAFEHSNDSRQATMAKTFTRELAELQEAMHYERVSQFDSYVDPSEVAAQVSAQEGPKSTPTNIRVSSSPSREGNKATILFDLNGTEHTLEYIRSDEIVRQVIFLKERQQELVRLEVPFATLKPVEKQVAFQIDSVDGLLAFKMSAVTSIMNISVKVGGVEVFHN